MTFVIRRTITIWSISFLLIVSHTLVAQTAEVPTGSGTENDPYHIGTVENLYWLSQEPSVWDANFIQTADIDLSDSENWNDGKGFSPIGNDSIVFSGVYDGNNFSISNLFINIDRNDRCDETDCDAKLGLFGLTEQANLIGITASEFYIYAGNYDVYFTIGSIVADASQTTVTNCVIKNANIEITGKWGDDIVSSGFIIGKAENTTVSNSNSSGELISRYGYFGGIVGLADGCEIINCYSTAKITAERYNAIGGLVGKTDPFNTVSTSFFVGVLSGCGTTGGIVGINEGKIDQCYFSGTGSGDEIGGISSDNYGEITNCYSSGEIEYYSDHRCANTEGGIVANNYEGIVNNSYSSIIPDRRYPIIGGVIGSDVRGSSNNCYYSLDIFHKVGSELNQDIQFGAPLSFDEMRNQDSFEDWDFNTIWKINESTSFPMLTNLHNIPKILPDLGMVADLNSQYLDTIDLAIGHSAAFELIEAPEEMLLNENVISWQPIELSFQSHPVTIKVVDSLGFSATYSYPISVFDYAPGSGTAEDPYQIASAEHLYWLSQDSSVWDSHFIQTVDIDLSESKNWNGGRGFTPIGNNDKPFTGVYDGNDFDIDSLFMEKDRNDFYNVEPSGLFGVTENAELSRISMVSSTIESWGSDRVGGIVGHARFTTVDSCIVTNINVHGGWAIGSIVGEAENCTISVVKADGEVRAGVGGGVVGISNVTTISNCQSRVSVRSANGPAGGIVGVNGENSAITNSYSLSKSVKGEEAIGGVAGKNHGTISESYFYGTVYGDNPGGLAGSNYGEITNCFSAGQSIEKFDADFGFFNALGGFVGTNYGTISNSYSFTSTSNISSPSGAFVGVNKPGAQIANCYFNKDLSSLEIGIGDDQNEQQVTPLSFDEMRMQDQFEGWDFDTIWQINEGQSFPMFRNTRNVPIIYPNLKEAANIVTEYVDTIDVVIGTPASFELPIAPEGMSIESGVISWKASEVLETPVSLKAIDEQGLSSTYSFVIHVIDYDGLGTSEDPFQIRTIEQFDNVRNFLDRHFILMNDLDFTSVYSDYRGWWPIGDERNPFTGSFDGNGHVVKGFYSSWIELNHIGLFGYISNASIENLGLDVVVHGGNNVGMLVGTSYQSTVSSCYVAGNVEGYMGNGLDPTGFIVGGMVGRLLESKLMNCYSTAEVNGISGVGGLIGYTSSSEIENCYASGKVLAENYGAGLIDINENSSISSSYFNLETSSQSIGIRDNRSDQQVEALVTEQMQSRSSFSGWDFAGLTSDGTEDIWTIDPSMNNGFPVLAWQSSYVLSVSDPDIVLYPNPADHYIRFDLPGVDGFAREIRILDVTGKVVSLLKEVDLSIDLNVEQYDPGVYYLIADIGGHQRVVRWIKR